FILVAIFGMLFIYERGNRVIAATLLTFAVSFKFYPLIFLAAFAARRDNRFLLFTVITCCAFLFVVPGVLLGVDDTIGFYDVLFNSFRESDWIVTNPHSQFFPHLILRLTYATEHDASAYLTLLHWIAYGVAAANLALLFLVQRARLSHANIWSFQILFLTIPFILKTSWAHDFFYLPFVQTLLAWRLLGGEENAAVKYTGGKLTYLTTWLKRTSPLRVNVMFFLLLPSILVSNVFFFNFFDNFFGYGFIGFLFWANLLLLIATYMELLPPALHGFVYRHQPLNTKNEK
ncbi:MAG: glycosyltransferase 87 family protein, partial [Ignavibacteriaceae bacterium]